MRILYGLFACVLWMLFLGWLHSQIGDKLELSNEVVLFSTAIIIAGAMAGGD